MAADNDKRLCVVFLMGPLVPPDALDRPKSRCRHGSVTGGMSRLYHIRGGRGKNPYPEAKHRLVRNITIREFFVVPCPRGMPLPN